MPDGPVATSAIAPSPLSAHSGLRRWLIVVLAAFPSPHTGEIHVGPFAVHVYGLMYAIGVCAAVMLAERVTHVPRSPVAVAPLTASSDAARTNSH
jgi:hypothetical protein